MVVSHEIKLKLNDVEQGLSGLQTATQALEASLENDIAAENQLEIVHQLNELNTGLARLIEIYKGLLLKNEAATQQSVETMFEMDELLSNNMK